MKEKLVIIGAGPGGYETALSAAKKGFEVTIVEKCEYGGVCLNEGCIPTKILLHGTKSYKQLNSLSRFGINFENPSFDYNALQTYKNQTINSLKQGIIFNLSKENITMLQGTAKLLDNKYLFVDQTLIPFDYLIIATGSIPKTLNIPININNPLYDSTSILKLKELPVELCIIGGGVMGIEFATLFSNLGVKVKVIEYFDEVLPAFDSEASKRIRINLKKAGVEFLLSTKVLAINESDQYQITYLQNNIENVLTTPAILMVTGRQPNLNTLNLNVLSIQTENNAIKVNEFYQTNVANIYAIGDCVGKQMLAHGASHHGKIALAHILKEKFNNTNLIPSVVYGNLELANIGLTESECQKQNIKYFTKKSSYYRNGKAVCLGYDEGFVKLIFDEKQKIIGATILGESADILIHEIATIMHYNGTINDIEEIVHAHPSLSEVIGDIMKSLI